ncbi:hypothetical protein Mapa_006726 [Marchantia paleacea]|nr:hypothetical protein Mapa_006726 [Marchantia paleacea]
MVIRFTCMDLYQQSSSEFPRSMAAALNSSSSKMLFEFNFLPITTCPQPSCQYNKPAAVPLNIHV